MTLNNNNEIILISWLRTLRYSIENYEDVCALNNKQPQRENNQSAKNMIIGSETNEDSEDEQYVNIWECSDSGRKRKSVSKIQSSLESVGNYSEVSNFGDENSSSSFNTYSTTDLSIGSYSLEDTQSIHRSFEDTTSSTSDSHPTKPKKPKATPRKSLELTKSKVLYENLPIKPQNSPIKQDDNQLIPKNRNLTSEASPIYENLPSRPQTHAQSCDSLSDSSNFEEKVNTTIQYLENILDEVDTFSDDSDFEECQVSISVDPKGSLESDVSSTHSKVEDEALPQVEEKFTESSSSFEEYVTKETDHEGAELRPQTLNQRFAKESRVSAFFEEAEPVLPQEVKNIPIPKIKTNRCSVPDVLRRLQDVLDEKRPQSLQDTSSQTFNIEDFERFREFIYNELIQAKITDIDTEEIEAQQSNEGYFEEEGRSSFESALDEPIYENLKDISKRSNKNKNSSDDSKEPTEDRKESSQYFDCEDSIASDLNLSFAKELRVSTLFEEGLVEELCNLEVEPEKILFEEGEILDGLKGDSLHWMADLMEEFCGENMDIMEEKELLKSINQFPKERIERPTENRFPLDDENVEIRRKPSIRSNRISKTTDFDFGRRRQEIPVSPKNFDIRGIVKFQLPNNTCIVKLNEEYVAYENENFYRINEKTKSKVLLVPNVIIKLARYTKSKESKEVELRDNQNASYLLYFHTIKNAKQFMDNEKIQVYVSDNKTTIKKTLLRFLGKRSSREILEKKGIYKNEPIFGNTLRDIYNKSAAYSPVPSFIYRVIDLIEKPENIKSLGLYRTSGNLATIQKIRFEVDNGRLDILNQFSKDPDVLTGSLKLFFRELKEPLIPCDVCEKLMGITKSDPKQIPSKDHQKIRSTLVKHLHEANLETFAVVMRHLLEVIKYKEHNKMDAYNLAVCWGPSMIFSVHGANASPTIELSKDIVTQSHDATRLVDFLLGYYELYPSELGAITKRPESLTEKILTLKRQESRDSVESSDSSKSQKKSSSNLSLSVDEITKKLIDMIDPHLSSEGIYKKPGSVEKTNKIIKKLNKKKINDLDKYKTDVYDLTDALKRYLSEQECLVTKEIISSVLKYTNGKTHNYMEPITRRKVVSIIEETPKKDTLIYLLRHLAKVIDHQSQHKVSKSDIVNVWTCVLNLQKKCHVSNEDFDKFLTVAIEVFNNNLPDVVRSSFNNNGSSPNRNNIMGEVVKQIKHQQERDRNSRYDNVDCDATGEASILDDGKTEQTKL